MSDKLEFTAPIIPNSVPKINIHDFKDAFRNYAHADYQHEIIMNSIAEFESELNDNEEVALKLTSFGQTVILSVTDIGYSNPSLIHFHGYVDGQKATIIQHINQLSFMIMATPVIKIGTMPRRIGFVTDVD